MNSAKAKMDLLLNDVKEREEKILVLQNDLKVARNQYNKIAQTHSNEKDVCKDTKERPTPKLNKIQDNAQFQSSP